MSRTSPTILLSYTLLTFLCIHHSHSQCSNLNADSATCQSDGYCLLNTDTECVCGQTSWNQDIAFIFDSSMSPLEWIYSREFARDLLYYASPSRTTTRAAILQTGDGSPTSTITVPFTQQTLNITIDSTLPTLFQSFTNKFYLQISLQNALDLFTSSSNNDTRKVLIIFASQQFAQTACKINMRANEIFTYTLAIGGWDSYPLICVGSSQNNYQGLQTVNNAEFLRDTLLTTMEGIVCPHEPLLKLTEIQLGGSPSSQYIELYNYGHDISDMSSIQLSGIGSGALNPASLSQGSYAVIYNTDTAQMAKAEIPNCANCACDEDASTAATGGIKWCANVVYYGCCVGNGCNNLYSFESTVSDCVFDNGLSMTSFTIGLIWTNPNNAQQITVQSLTFDTDKQWPVVATDYALELKNKGFNNEFGASWAMSCDTGTPGDGYLSANCSFDCTPAPTGQGYALCDLNGGGHYDITDDEPGCVASTGSCSCETGYYAHYHTCLPLPGPTNCTSEVITLSASSASFLVPEWDGDATYTYFHCESYPESCVGGVQYSSSPTSLLNPIVYDPGREDNATMFTLSAIGTGGEKWFSQRAECTYVTGNPTADPTPSPTMSVPLVPSCIITLSADLYSFDIQWQAIDHVNTSAVDRFDGYVYYFNDIRRSIAAPCCQLNSETPPGSKIFNLSLPDTVSVSGDWDSILTDVTSLEELLSATLCTVATQIPTTTPTTHPTQIPTPSPTAIPSSSPTPAPTLGELHVPECSATVLQGSTTLDMAWTEANFTASTAPKSDTKYKIEWFYNNGRAPGVQIVFADQPPRPIQVDDYLNVTLLQMYCTWSSFTEEGSRTNCSISTVQPTPAPTAVPSTTPTRSPTKSPSKSPSKYPSAAPTESPTYTYDEVTWCHAVFNVQFEIGVVTLSWGLLDVDDTDLDTPPADSISYTGTIGDGSTTVRATHDSAFIKCNVADPTDCWGEAQKALTPNVGGGWGDVSKATFYAEYSLAGIRRTNTINCTVDTPEPTVSPTENPSRSPTMSPTLSEVWVYLDNTACQEDRCGCRSTQPSADNPDCCYNACEWDRQPAPVIIVSEKSESNTTFYVRRNIQNYPYTVQVEYNITAVRRDIAYEYGFYDRIKQIEAGDYNDVDIANQTLTANETSNATDASNRNISYIIPPDCYFDNDEKCSKEEEFDSSIDENAYSLYECANGKKRGHKEHECSWCDYRDIPGPRCDDIAPSGGQFIIPHTDLLSVDGGTFEQATFELAIKTEGCTHGCDYEGEVFMLELTKCAVIQNYKNLLSASQLADLGATAGDILECTLIYPTRVFIIVMDQDVTSIVEEEIIADTSYNDWLWYVIGAAVLVLAGLSYVAYIWWKNKKMKELDVAMVEEDMEAVIEEQELGWQVDEGMVAVANPLATIGGVQKPVDTFGAEYDPAANQKIKDVAAVGIEKFDERVEYGQQRGGDDYGDVV